jgi:hypothetical protein
LNPSCSNSSARRKLFDPFVSGEADGVGPSEWLALARAHAALVQHAAADADDHRAHATEAFERATRLALDQGDQGDTSLLVRVVNDASRSL